MSLFLSGDYEFLCRVYGLSGASGNVHIHISTLYNCNSPIQGGTAACGARSHTRTLRHPWNQKTVTNKDTGNAEERPPKVPR